MLYKFYFRFYQEIIFILINKISNYTNKIYLLNFALKKQKLIPLLHQKKINSRIHLFKNLKYKYKKDKIFGPLVSVVVTYYDNHELINFSIQSLLNQTYSNIQIIIVFDGCKKKTILKLKKKFNNYRINFIVLKKKLGNANAKNSAIPLIKGSYVTVHDSDDIAHPQKIERHIYPLLYDKNFNASVSYWIRVDSKFQIRSLRNNFFTTRLNPSSILFKKNLLNFINWKNKKKGNDTIFFQKILNREKKILYIKNILTIGSFRLNSISNS